MSSIDPELARWVPIPCVAAATWAVGVRPSSLPEYCVAAVSIAIVAWAYAMHQRDDRHLEAAAFLLAVSPAAAGLAFSGSAAGLTVVAVAAVLSFLVAGAARQLPPLVQSYAPAGAAVAAVCCWWLLTLDRNDPQGVSDALMSTGQLFDRATSTFGADPAASAGLSGLWWMGSIGVLAGTAWIAGYLSRVAWLAVALAAVPATSALAALVDARPDSHIAVLLVACGVVAVGRSSAQPEADLAVARLITSSVIAIWVLVAYRTARANHVGIALGGFGLALVAVAGWQLFAAAMLSDRTRDTASLSVRP